MNHLTNKFICLSLSLTTMSCFASSKLTRNDVLIRTKQMLMRDCSLPNEPLSSDRLDDLGCGDERALAASINNVDFVDVDADVKIWDLNDAGRKTVADLRDLILSRIAQ